MYYNQQQSPQRPPLLIKNQAIPHQQNEMPQNEVRVLQRGACLYVGGEGDVVVEMESGSKVKFAGVAAGSFLPIQVTKVYSKADGTTASNILALF